MADDKLTLDTVISQVETILRLRAGVRVANETIVRTTRELGVHREELAKYETILADAIGVKPYAERVQEDNDALLATMQRIPYPKARKGQLVWIGRRKELGRLQKDGRVKNLAGKIYKCPAKDLWMPFPGEGETAW